MTLSELCIRRPVMTTLLTASIIAFGVFGFRLLPVSALPKVDFPTIAVTATLPGATIDLASPDASGQRVSAIYGEHNLDCAGDSVRTYDINKDGLSDLFIGSPERTFTLNGEDRDDAGVTEIIYGQRDFLPPVIKLYDPPASPPIFRLAGAHGDDQGLEGGDEFSYRLAGADIDGGTRHSRSLTRVSLRW